MRLNKNDVNPLFQQLEDLIREQINNGTLSPGDRIPSESEFSKTHGISRMTVRRALDRLAMEGLLVRKQGKGAFVAKGKFHYTPSTTFSFSTTLKRLGHSVQTRVIDLRIVPTPPLPALDLGITEGSPSIYLERIRFVDQKPAALHTAYMPSVYFSGLLSEDLAAEPLNVLMQKVSGLSISRSVDTIEAALIRPKEAALLEVNENAPILLVRGTAYTESGLPIKSTKAIYRGDLFRFSINPESNSPILQVMLPVQKTINEIKSV